MRNKTVEIKNKILSLSNRFFYPTWKIFPRCIQIDINNNCNIACVYCNVKAGTSFGIKREIMNDKVFYDIILAIEPYKNYIESVALFMNGEPLLDKRLNRFHNYLMDYPYYGIIDSNGVLTEKADNLIHPFIQTIRISLSAHCRNLYDYIHGKDYFENVIETLEYINKNKLPYQNLFINHMICKENYKFLNQFISKFKGYNINLFPLHTGYLQDSSKEHEYRLIDENIMINEKGEIYYPYNIYRTFKKCQCWDLLGIGIHGEIMDCVDYPSTYNYGTIYETSIRKAWSLRLKNVENRLCKWCNLYFNEWRNK